MYINDIASSDSKLQLLFSSGLFLSFVCIFFLSRILLMPLWVLSLAVVPQSPFCCFEASTLEFLHLNQFWGKSWADDLQRGLWCSPTCPAKRCQFSLLVNPDGLWEKGPTAVSHQSPSYPSLHPLSALLGFFVGHGLSAVIMESPFSETWWNKSLFLAISIFSVTPLNIKCCILISSH